MKNGSHNCFDSVIETVQSYRQTWGGSAVCTLLAFSFIFKTYCYKEKLYPSAVFDDIKLTDDNEIEDKINILVALTDCCFE